ncbi:hypothetical protein JCGZ_19758 [Jatropha curcas]|uniref:Uncharacterized protein n=1 Tax=Jatropha curcas TaxID=180498 RepID=A0A067L824_JATCU|nr:hypothetical protein JCGZ_19758 [Jatropha curcas]
MWHPSSGLTGLGGGCYRLNRVDQSMRLGVDYQKKCSEGEVNEVGVQSLTRSGRVYNLESSMQAKGKEVAVDGTKKRITEKGGEEPKEKKKEEEVVKGQKKAVEVGESSQSKAPSGVTASSVLSQLQRIRADISIWDLLIASKEHREALLKAMTFVRVPARIQSVDMINVLQRRIGEVTFFDSNLLPE